MNLRQEVAWPGINVKKIFFLVTAMPNQWNWGHIHKTFIVHNYGCAKKLVCPLQAFSAKALP
jgi:hypothetical protein